MTMPPGSLLSSYLNQVDWSHTYKLQTKRYHPNYLSNSEANEASWSDFSNKAQVLYRGVIPRTNLVFLLISKSTTWSGRDTSIFIGTENKEVRSFLDLSSDEFIAVFAWHLDIVRKLAGYLKTDIYVTHGFNPEDAAPDAHSIRSKFHTHIHIPNLSDRYQVEATDLSQFEKLSLIEPFSRFYWDFLRSQDHGVYLSTKEHFGYLSLTSDPSKSRDTFLRHLHKLLLSFNKKYSELVFIFTDGSTESTTQYERYVPRNSLQRHALLKEFMDKNKKWLSNESGELLTYLAEHIKPAEPRYPYNSTEIRNSAQLWLAKGFSGAINFIAPKDDGTIQFDFAPRIISTSGAAKIISDGPTIIVKGASMATSMDKVIMCEFEKAVIDALPSDKY